MYAAVSDKIKYCRLLKAFIHNFSLLIIGKNSTLLMLVVLSKQNPLV